jgi:mono/diheme cytochrome c family protein
MYCLAIMSSIFAIRSEAGEARDLSGAELYKSFCASCHGAQGHGDGPVAPSLKKRPADLTLLAQRWGGVFSAEKVHQMIDGRSMPRAHGSSDMPVWGWEFYGYEGEDATRRRHVAEFIDQLVDYLQSIQSPLK